MGNHDIGFWELAAAPYDPPADDESLGVSSSSCFDPITGSWLAQSFLRAVLPRAYIPLNSHKIASPCWPRGPLLRDARPRCTSGKFLLSNLLTDNGLHPDFEPPGDEWQPFDILALGYKHLRERREKNQEKEMDAEYRERGQREDNDRSWNETEEYANFFNTWPVQVVTVVKNSCFTFRKKPITQVSTISLMPAPDTIRLVAKRLNPTLKDFREQYGPQPDLPSAFSDTTASSYYSSEGSYIANPFYRGDDQAEEHTAPIANVDRKFPTSAVPSFETVADTDRPDWEYGLDKVVPMNVRGQGHLIPAPPIKSFSGTVSTCAEQDKTSVCVTPSIRLVGDAQAGVGHRSLASPGSYKSSESVFDSEPGESAQPSSDTNDPNTVRLRTFLLDSEDEDNDEHDFSDEVSVHPLFHAISQTSPTAAADTRLDDLYEYIINDNAQLPTPNSAPPITTATIDAAERSLISGLGLANILSTEPDLARNRTPPPDPTMPATTTSEERYSSTLTPQARRSSVVSFDLNTPRRSAEKPPGLRAWIVHGARRMIHLAKRVNCVCAGADTEAPVTRAGERKRLAKKRGRCSRCRRFVMRIVLGVAR